LNWLNPTQDFYLHVLLRTCGTGSLGAKQFSSTSHNATIYCDNRGLAGADCTDIKVQSWTLTFLGQFNLTTVYNQTNTTVTMFAESLSQSKSFPNAVDFALSYANMTFLDCPPGSRCFGPFTFQVESFVATYPVFEMDWSDFNNDGKVNILDAADVSNYYGQSCVTAGSPQCYWAFDGTGVVDRYDVDLVSSYFDKSFNGIPFFPGAGCSTYRFNNAACQPPDSPSSSCASATVPGSCFAVHPKWISSCSIFPQPDQNYCLQRTPS
jgi:hypothetical protein